MYTIHKFNEITNIISELNPETNKIIIGFDWDNCISLYNGCQSPLRDGVETTETLDYINDLQILWFIITARFGGKDPSTKSAFNQQQNDTTSTSHAGICIGNMVESMYEELPPMKDRIPVGKIDTDDVLLIKHQFGASNVEKTGYTIINNGVIFAGGKTDNFNKGKAIISYMAMGYLPPVIDWDYFVFVDNDLTNVIQVENAFKVNGFYDKLITIYYPQTPLLYGTCQNSYNASQCFTDAGIHEKAKRDVSKMRTKRITAGIDTKINEINNQVPEQKETINKSFQKVKVNRNRYINRKK